MFYALENVQFNKMNIGTYQYFLQNGDVKKVIHKTDTLIIEFYYDINYMTSRPYFIFTTNKVNATENRYYFGSDQTLIRWLDPNKKEVNPDKDGYCYMPKKLSAIGQDLLTIYNNNSINNHPDFIEITARIEEKVKLLTN